MILIFTKLKKHVTAVIVIILLSYAISKFLQPINITDLSIEISTPNADNPYEKIITYEFKVENILPFLNISFDFVAKKEDVGTTEHPYYNLIPDEAIYPERIELSANENKEISFSKTIETDDNRLINTSLSDMIKAHYSNIHRYLK